EPHPQGAIRPLQTPFKNARAPQDGLRGRGEPPDDGPRSWASEPPLARIAHDCYERRRAWGTECEDESLSSPFQKAQTAWLTSEILEASARNGNHSLAIDSSTHFGGMLLAHSFEATSP